MYMRQRCLIENCRIFRREDDRKYDDDERGGSRKRNRAFSGVAIKPSRERAAYKIFLQRAFSSASRYFVLT